MSTESENRHYGNSEAVASTHLCTAGKVPHSWGYRHGPGHGNHTVQFCLMCDTQVIECPAEADRDAWRARAEKAEAEMNELKRGEGMTGPLLTGAHAGACKHNVADNWGGLPALTCKICAVDALDEALKALAASKSTGSYDVYWQGLVRERDEFRAKLAVAEAEVLEERQHCDDKSANNLEIQEQRDASLARAERAEALLALTPDSAVALGVIPMRTAYRAVEEKMALVTAAQASVAELEEALKQCQVAMENCREDIEEAPQYAIALYDAAVERARKALGETKP